ncbi:MAG: glycosyltransferase family 4 protein [Pseudomonadota bacterium]
MPSGDRTIARLLVQALESAGTHVVVPSTLRSFDARGDRDNQRAIRKAGRREARALINRLAAEPPTSRPAMWFTYHLYHKAPDWVGPLVARALGIPYVLAEASYAAKQRHGPWAAGLASTRQAICQASAIFTLNPRDRGALVALHGNAKRLHALTPFLDTDPFAGQRHLQRDRLAAQHGLDTGIPWLISVGMVRPGDKLASFAMQRDVLSSLSDCDWHWLVVGDGEASAELDRLIAPLGARVTRLGALDKTTLALWLRNADLAVWPALNEAIGMALLEAQAAGLPVLAGHTPGVAAICDNAGCTVVPQNVASLASALRELLTARDQLADRGALARQSVNGIADAGQALSGVLDPLLARSTQGR